MVEYSLNLDAVFGSLASPTRRDILRRVSEHELSVGDIAKPYNMTLAAISKHLKVLEKAQLVSKRKRGNEHVVQLSPQALADVDGYLNQYRRFWTDRFEALETLLENEQQKPNVKRS